MTISEEKRSIQKELDLLLSKKTLTAAERKQADVLLAKAAQLRDHEDRQNRAAAAMKEFGSANGNNNGSAFRKKFLGQESRTYVPLTESGGNGAPLVPSNFEVRLKNLMLADGPLFAGSPLITNLYANVMRSTRIVTSDDTASTGMIVTEASQVSEAELTGLSGVSVGGTSNRYSTGILIASVELVEDADSFDAFEDIVARAAGQRLSRIQNATNLTMVKTGLAANSSAAVSPAGGSIAAADVYTLVGAVGAAYRSNAAFIMSKQKQAALGELVTSAGIREFPQVLEAKPKLLGYDVHILNSAAAGDILFGDFSFITGKSTPVEMRVLHERFRDQGQYGYIMAERAEAKWSVASGSDSPVKYLTF